MRWFAISLAMAFVVGQSAWGQASVSPRGEEDRAENRVGRTYWARPGLNDSSVDFFRDVTLRERAPVSKKTRFRIVDIEVRGEAPAAEISYRVRFDDKSAAYIGLPSFEKALYRELAPNQVMTAPPNSAIGAAPHVWIFERSGIFAADPDIIWERIKNEGPRTFKPFKRPAS